VTESVIKVVGLVDGTPTAFDGQYLVEYDLTRDGVEPRTGASMMVHLVTTPDITKAARYETGAALELWRSVDPRCPVRPDGEPNRPLTAFSIEIGPVEEVNEDG